MRSILRWIQAQLTNDKRNIHFYVNVCGFYITEFFNENHPMPDTPDDFVGDGNEGMFEFWELEKSELCAQKRASSLTGGMPVR